MKKSELKQIIKEEFNNLIKEKKASSISVGDTFKLSGDLGKFKTGEEIEVVSVTNSGNDIKLVLSNGPHTDDFYIDRNDTLDELDESIFEELN
jgi:hypothetical protein